MGQIHRTLTDDELIAESLARYERWRQMRGLPLENRWRVKLTKEGIPLNPIPAFERGDAFEDDS